MASPSQILAHAKLYRVINTELALKIAFEPGEADAVEKRMYERLGTSHPLILKCYGEAESVLGKGLVLQYLPVGTLAGNLELERFPIERSQWPAQAVEAIRYIHSKGVIHCDIGAHNFLIQNDGSIALADFCGSILDGSTSLAATSARSTEKDDIFALGTVLYEISVGHRLYADRSDGEIWELFQKREFPCLTGLARSLRSVIEKCWRDQYNSTEEVKSDLDIAIDRL
ncbi:hypothetical protein M430DRAFT_48385 [Amorphotheca resinae ATCC 22711]|uniref:non-specific serine/threonine protein kinase n=1 Tax=Amorphotheca resinae ATCC 22711 TaxID=857342 RepID=A0A2T3B7A7_AMORE|nr:hypothetical protein M430DRAFT_48385 [Amorphotheca resinae ATCC 22711]PSS22745.1 hypothetical protein M430DRAFT_48385 [Amorphotheca resinae ATCC 22711]